MLVKGAPSCVNICQRYETTISINNEHQRNNKPLQNENKSLRYHDISEEEGPPQEDTTGEVMTFTSLDDLQEVLGPVEGMVKCRTAGPDICFSKATAKERRHYKCLHLSLTKTFLRYMKWPQTQILLFQSTFCHLTSKEIPNIKIRQSWDILSLQWETLYLEDGLHI